MLPNVMERAFAVEMLRGMAPADTSFIRLMLERRHVFEHEASVATRRYLAASGDTSVGEGTLIRETKENAHRLAGYLVRMATNFEIGFHEIYPVATVSSNGLVDWSNAT